MDLGTLGKWMLILGLALAAIGALLGRLPFLGNLPGDIHIQNENFGCFIPLGSMLLLSLILTALLNIAARLLNK